MKEIYNERNRIREEVTKFKEDHSIIGMIKQKYEEKDIPKNSTLNLGYISRPKQDDSYNYGCVHL